MPDTVPFSLITGQLRSAVTLGFDLAEIMYTKCRPIHVLIMINLFHGPQELDE